MNTNIVNRWLTLGANVGVLIGIFFLAVELRQNNELLQSAAGVTYVEMRRDGLISLFQNDELLKSMVKAREGGDLNQLESMRLETFYRAVFVNWQWEYEQYETGTLDVLDQPPELRWRPAVSYYPLMREIWSAQKSAYSPRFVQYMEENVLK